MRKCFNLVLMQLSIKFSLKYCFYKGKIVPLVFVEMFEEDVGGENNPENNRDTHTNDIFTPIWAIYNFKQPEIIREHDLEGL